MAHILQSHGDCADSLSPELERAASSLLPVSSRDDSPDDLWVLGAYGRALAAFFRYDEAERLLQRAVEGWFELDVLEDASHALSELLRVLAVTGQHEVFARAAQSYANPLLQDARVASVSRAFIRYSVGRGQALLGNPAEAIRELSSDLTNWSLAPDHLRALRLRWLILAGRHQLETDLVERSMAELARLVQRAPHLEFARALTHLDEVVREGRDPHEAMTTFERCRPRECHRFLQAYGDAAAYRLTREYRY